jgi:hypothetical protein
MGRSRRRARRWTRPRVATALASSLLLACDPTGEPDDPTIWTVDLHGADVYVYQPGEDGCLAPTDERLGAASTVEVLGADERWYLLAEGFRLIRRDNALGEHRPDVLRPRPEAVVQRAGPRWVFGTDGCPVESSALWEEGDVVTRLARSHDAQYRGFALVDDALEMAPVRHVDGWDSPWEAGVQLIAEVPEGFVVGGGVLIDPWTLLTAAHLGVDEGFCWSRGPSAQAAWAAGEFHCTVDSVVDHDRVDLSVVRLSEPADGPFAPLRQTFLEEGDPFYVQRFGAQQARDFADSTVHSVGLNNAWCEAWPYPSTFTSVDLLVGPGDSGGPAYSGGELVGVVHGEACFPVNDEQGRHTFVHLPALLDFIADASE